MADDQRFEGGIVSLGYAPTESSIVRLFHRLNEHRPQRLILDGARLRHGRSHSLKDNGGTSAVPQICPWTTH
jgi:hypothetical protein